MFGPILAGTYIRLEPPRSEYASDYMRWFADPEVTLFMDVKNPRSLQQQQCWFEDMAASEHDIIWTVVLAETGQVIGDTGLHRIDWRHRQAYSRLLIGERSMWGKGYGSEVVALRTRYAFLELGLEKVISTVHSGNERSRRALEGGGYAQCGLLRRNRFYNGTWHDEWMGEVLRDEWMAGHAAQVLQNAQAEQLPLPQSGIVVDHT